MKNNIGQKCIALDFGKTSIKFAVGSFKNNELKIEKLFTEFIDVGIYDNGNIYDKVSLSNIIKKAITKNKIKYKNVICTIDNSEIIRKEMTVPKVDDDDILDMITTEIGTMLPIDINSYIVQYKIVDDFKDKAIQKLKLSTAIMNRDVVLAHSQVIKSAGLKPEVLDLNSSSVENMMKYIILKNIDSTEYKKPEISNQTIVMLEIGSSAALINIFKDGVGVFNRFVKIKDTDPSSGFTNSDISQYKSIEEIKDSNIFAAINEIISEIDMVFKYYTSRSSNNKIDEIFVYGGIGNTEGLDKYMEDIVNITTNRIVNLKSVIDSEQFVDIELSTYINSIGAIIRW